MDTPYLKLSGIIEDNHLKGNIHLPVRLHPAIRCKVAQWRVIFINRQTKYIFRNNRLHFSAVYVSLRSDEYNTPIL